MPGGYSKKELEDTSMESYESWRSARPHPPSNPFGDALPPRPAQGGGEDDEKARRSRKFWISITKTPNPVLRQPICAAA